MKDRLFVKLPRLRMIGVIALALTVPNATHAQMAASSAPPVAPAPVAVQPPPAPIDPHAIFDGGPFAYVGGERERQAQWAAIDRAVADIFFMFRGIARGRLRDLNPLYPLIGVHFNNGQIEVVLHGQPPFRSPENGTRAPWSAANGDSFQIAQRLENGHVIQEIYGPGGMRRNELVISPDGHNLALRVRITASQLPQPLIYTLSYRR